MKLRLFTTSLLLLAFSSVICVAESRYVTLSVSGTNQTDQITLQDFEVARLASASDHSNCLLAECREVFFLDIFYLRG